MIVDRTPDDKWTILAPWLDEPVTAATFEEAYALALKARGAIASSSE